VALPLSAFKMTTLVLALSLLRAKNSSGWVGEVKWILGGACTLALILHINVELSVFTTLLVLMMC